LLLTATKIHDGRNWLPEGTMIETDNEGKILNIHNNAAHLDGVQFFDGVLAPGFVNAHCHLELSHLKGVIPEHTGLMAFLQMVIGRRNDFTDEQKVLAREEAFTYMLDNGIVALGDICNTNDVMEQRASGKMHFHNFVEALGFSETPQKSFDYVKQVYDNYAAQPQDKTILRQSIVPHAPYSVSYVLFRMISDFDKDALISIHNQECPDEDEYYLLKQGGVKGLLKMLGINDDFFKPSGKTSLQTYLEWMSPTHPFLFIHNTCTTQTDVEVAMTLLKNVYWCLCPNANLYIENRLPNVGMLKAKGANICVGTDSLSSNHQLSILAELVTLRNNFPAIDWEELLRWGTYNGAEALQMQHVVGSIEAGKTPGIINITGLDTMQAKSVRIV
jgi:Cytosine deaminase and related metal-dependent hydrolases